MILAWLSSLMQISVPDCLILCFMVSLDGEFFRPV